jgi:hypothetical protein
LAARERRVVCGDQAECIDAIDCGGKFAVQVGNRHRMHKYKESILPLNLEVLKPTTMLDREMKHIKPMFCLFNQN